jgi:hypothetical protein
MTPTQPSSCHLTSVYHVLTPLQKSLTKNIVIFMLVITVVVEDDFLSTLSSSLPVLL